MPENEKILAKGSFISFVIKNGWEYVERNNCTATVAIIAVTPENELLLTEQFRIPLNKSVIELPAGLVNDRNNSALTAIDKSMPVFETIEQAANRELIEETGYSAGETEVIIEGPTSSGLTSELQTLILARNLIKVSEGGGDGTESIIVHKVPLEGIEYWLDQMRGKGFLVDPKIYAGLYFVVKRKKTG